MSKIHIYSLWLTLTVIHTWLFFEQSFGINALVFSFVMVPVVTFFHHLRNEKRWWLGVAGHFVSAIAVAWHGSEMAVWLYHLSFFLLAGLVFSVRSSFAVALLNGMLSSIAVGFLKSIPRFLQDGAQKLDSLPLLSRSSRRKANLYVAPITVTGIFYLIYCFANPQFLVEFHFPDLELNFGLILYLMFSLIVMCPLFFKWGLLELTAWDAGIPDILKRSKGKTTGKIRGLANENHQGVVMFAMLNLLIFVFLIFNILQLLIPSFGNELGSHSEQVHQGFETLIVSIFAAILLIMYYFRANQNFYSANQRLVKLATVWIVLNSLLALFTCYKNILYVDDFGLTYKRIWVFIGILLTGAGLFLTLFKIRRLRTNWFLVRQNTLVLYFVISFYSLVDWDRLITWFNPKYAEALDIEYIMGLGDTKLPYLKQLADRNDPRVSRYSKAIQKIVDEKYIPEVSSWKSETMDRRWLESELHK